MASLMRALGVSLSPAAPIRLGASLLRPFGGQVFTMSRWLIPTTTTTTGQMRGMKVHSSITKRCEHCKVVRRKAGKRHNGYLYVICKANPRHKQRQG
ncbi:hypothetical protein CP533_3888 [Ophiocordyceps camponoti-saundersi (nom. inval.)]|nr:hypothetical protein CP533_3888 [Ophiocordyceps camponoti-saundersi (nom. inval.)]